MFAIFARLVASFVVFACWGALSFGASIFAMLASGQAGGAQFENSDAAFVSSMIIMRAANAPAALIAFFAILILAAIWWAPIARLVKLATAATAALVVLALLPAPQASAYYNKTDYADPFFILPSESAFFIPDAGANKDSQASFGSEQYLKENKIAAKRFLVPHVKLPATGGYFEGDYYVPSGRLIILDRTPVNREWVSASHRGTSTKDESFPCQTAEGLDYKVGIAIAAFVTEDSAAKFLYWFGVNTPPGDRSKPEIIFTSVYYARSLAQVMDSVVRSKVQALVCQEVVKRTMDKANAEMASMMTAIQGSVEAYLASRGVTLDFIGWADTVNFDPHVQDAINRRYVADKDSAIADALSTKVATIQAVATAEATRTLANKWNGAMPSQVSLWWLPSGLSDAITGIFNNKK